MATLITAIPVYNGERFIAATLASLAAQTRKPDRVVILDNGSTDRTREIVASTAGPQTEYRLNERNLGMFGNMNRALDLAPETDYLHVLHADDLIKPAFYQELEVLLDKMPGAGLAYAQSDFIDETGAPSRLGHRHRTDFENCQDVDSFLRVRAELQPIVCPAVLLKTARQPAPVRFREDMPQLADLVFWAEWAHATGNVANHPDILARYRVHPHSGTSTNACNLQSFVLDEWRAMQIIEPLRCRDQGPSWWRQEKLRLIFAARSMVKASTAEPMQARLIRQAALQEAGWIPVQLAKFLVGLRNGLHYLRSS